MKLVLKCNFYFDIKIYFLAYSIELALIRSNTVCLGKGQRVRSSCIICQPSGALTYL